MNINIFPQNINEELAEETGWHIGDGSMNYYKKDKKIMGFYQLRGHIEDDKPHYINRIKPIFKNLYGIDISLREMPSTRVFGFQIWSNELVKFKQELGLLLGPKTKIVIPPQFLSNKELKIAVIRGIFDTDGCVYLERKNHKLYPRMQIVTISLPLAEQLKYEFINLGLRATIHKNGIGIGNKKDSYATTIRGNEMFNKFISIIKPKNPKHIAKYNHYKQSFKHQGHSS